MNFEIDHSLTTFSSEGKLNQCEHALKASQNGTLSISCQSNDGIVLASLKLFSPLVDISKIQKVFQICDNIGMTYAGLQPDFRIIHEKACSLAQSYFNIYGRYPYVDIFVKNLSRVIQEYTQKGGLRPFGVSILVAGYVKNKPELYLIEPSGCFYEKEFAGIGKENINAEKFVGNRRESLDDNTVNCVKALREFAGRGIEIQNVDVGILKDGKFKIMKGEGVKEIFDLFAQH